MKYQNKLRLFACFAFLSALSIISCSEMDDYKEFAEGGEISYTGKVDSLEVFSGRERLKVQGLFIGDPKIVEARIYWNGGKDSTVVPVERGAGIDTLSVILDNLPENIYNFEVRTFDAQGNKSIPVYAMGEVFGERYQQSLNNRPVISNILVGDSLTINYAGMDRTSGVIGTTVDYTNVDGEEENVFVPIDSSIATINNFQSGSEYEYRTVFLPEPTAIDTFYTESVAFTPIPTPVLKNASVPFKASEVGGRWGILAEPWITNDSIKIHNGYGGWDEWNNNIFNVESGWGAPAITNGKIYQTVEVVQPSTFILKVRLMNTNHQETDEGGAYVVVAEGEGLPDIENLDSSEEVLGYKRILESLPNEYKVEFTTKEPGQIISVGYVTTQADGWPGRFANILSWEILQP